MDFSKHIQRADDALKRKNHDYAIELYRQLIDLDPDLGEARAGLRRALKAKHEARRGGRLLRAVSGALPLGRAKTLRKLGKHEAAARALEAYLATNPLDEEANLELGMALEEAGHFRSAGAVYEFLAEIAPRNPEGLKRAGAMVQRLGETERALDYYERALAADPRDRDALKARKNLAAETALNRSRSGEVRHSRELIKDKEAYDRRERAERRHLSQDELGRELARLQEQLAESPGDADLLIALAGVQERLGDPEAALDAAERARTYRRDSFELVVRVGELRSRVLEQRIARAEGDEARRLEAELVDHEVDDHRRRVELRPGEPALRLALARKLMRRADVDQAIAELQRCQADARVRDEATFLVARCFHEKGILDLARKSYERALDGSDGVDERAKEILYNLGAIAEAQGDLAEARAHYIRIYEVDIGYRDVAAKMGNPS